MKILLALLFALPLAAQVEVVCGPLPTAYSRSIFDKRTAKNIQPWSCVLTNMTPGPASVSEAAIQGWMLRQGVSALSADAIRIGAGEIKRRGVWSTAARTLPMVAMLGTALVATEGLMIEEAWIKGAFAFGAFALPQIGERLGQRNPDDAIFEQLAIHSDVPLDAGKSATVYMWSAPLPGAQTIQGMIVVAEPPLVSEVIQQYEYDPWAEAQARFAGGG